MIGFLQGIGYTFLFIAVCLVAALLIRRFTGIGPEPFRKLLHGIAQSLILCFVYGFKTWHHAVVFCGFFIAAGYPALSFLERFPLYSRLTNERRRSEVKNSLVLLFTMYALILSVCWGYLNDKLLAVASVFAWGFGDAAAALIGRRYGKHKVRGSKKSWEGTLSMFCVSLVCVLAVLIIRGKLPVWACLLAAAITAVVSSAVELVTTGGHDTITCPLSAMIVLLPLVHFLEAM